MDPHLDKLTNGVDLSGRVAMGSVEPAPQRLQARGARHPAWTLRSGARRRARVSRTTTPLGRSTAFATIDMADLIPSPTARCSSQSTFHNAISSGDVIQGMALPAGMFDDMVNPHVQGRPLGYAPFSFGPRLSVTRCAGRPSGPTRGLLVTYRTNRPWPGAEAGQRSTGLRRYPAKSRRACASSPWASTSWSMTGFGSDAFGVPHRLRRSQTLPTRLTTPLRWTSLDSPPVVITTALRVAELQVHWPLRRGAEAGDERRIAPIGSHLACYSRAAPAPEHRGLLTARCCCEVHRGLPLDLGLPPGMGSTATTLLPFPRGGEHVDQSADPGRVAPVFHSKCFH